MPFYHADEASARQETCKQDAKAMLSGCEMLYIGAQNIAFCMTKLRKECNLLEMSVG